MILADIYLELALPHLQIASVALNAEPFGKEQKQEGEEHQEAAPMLTPLHSREFHGESAALCNHQTEYQGTSPSRR